MSINHCVISSTYQINIFFSLVFQSSDNIFDGFKQLWRPLLQILVIVVFHSNGCKDVIIHQSLANIRQLTRRQVSFLDGSIYVVLPGNPARRLQGTPVFDNRA